MTKSQHLARLASQPVYPSQSWVEIGGETVPEPAELGLDLRTWLAAKCLMAGETLHEQQPEKMARRAFALADAFIAELAQHRATEDADCNVEELARELRIRDEIALADREQERREREEAMIDMDAVAPGSKKEITEDQQIPF